MKQTFKIISIFLLSFICVSINASSTNKYVNLSDLTYSNDNNSFENIVEYETLEDYINNIENLPEIYITDFLYDGVSSVKSPDLDDFIENNSNDTEISVLKIKVLNINTIGDVELSGSVKGLMIGINTNNVKGNINLILNGVNIDTDSKKAPAIYVYNKDINYTECKVTIKTVSGTKNYIEGGKLKKVSLIGSDELSNYTSYYSNDALNNYEKYTSYYGIFESDDIENILFAMVNADNEDLMDGDPYSFYKASGAISSDIDLYFEGSGYLKVTSKNKEGIETKGNMTFSGGTGDYEINAQDDCLNTTTATKEGITVRNDLVIDVNSLIAIVSDDGDEGDAIDSNGKLTINGGTIYAFAHSKSQDSGLDSNNGIYINGGTIISTGNMADEISNQSKQKYIYVRFNETIQEDTLIVIKNQDDEIITAFKTSKNIQTLLYSTSDLNYDSYIIYSGGSIDGTQTNGLFSNINSYTNGTLVNYSEASNMMPQNSNNLNKNSFILYSLIVEISLLLITSIIAVIYNKKNKTIIQ